MPHSRLTLRDLWRHVAGGSRLPGHLVLYRPAAKGTADDLGEAEVHQLSLPAGRVADVVGLKVAVHEDPAIKGVKFVGVGGCSVGGVGVDIGVGVGGVVGIGVDVGFTAGVGVTVLLLLFLMLSLLCVSHR